MKVVPLKPQGASARGKAPEKSGLIAALDVGSNKVCCLIARVSPSRRKLPGARNEHEIRIIGVGHHASRGVHGGAVTDLDEAERAIRLAVDAAERMAEVTISEVFVNVSGGRPQCQRYAGAIGITGQTVTEADVAALLNGTIERIDPGKRIILHAAPMKFDLDEAKGVRDPVGMYGENLSADLNVVTIEPNAARNLALVVERCHLSIAGLAAAPYASGRAVLVQDEQELGVTLIEMGASTTSIAVFSEGHLIHSDVIPIGGRHITNDLGCGLSTTLAHAERLKTLHGSALPSVWDEREMLSVPLVGERGAETVQKIPRSMLTRIIQPRIEEIFEMVGERLAATPATDRIARRVVLTGGASQLTGAREVAAQVLDRHVRLGSPHPLPGLPEAAQNPSFAVAVGLLHYGVKPDHGIIALPSTRKGPMPAYLKRVGRWFKGS
ncbi:MAG: cell division protein FtsA [Parvibaculaceae bacterium]